jgi:hypothetical protein
MSELYDEGAGGDGGYEGDEPGGFAPLDPLAEPEEFGAAMDERLAAWGEQIAAGIAQQLGIEGPPAEPDGQYEPGPLDDPETRAQVMAQLGEQCGDRLTEVGLDSSLHQAALDSAVRHFEAAAGQLDPNLHGEFWSQLVDLYGQAVAQAAANEQQTAAGMDIARRMFEQERRLLGDFDETAAYRRAMEILPHLLDRFDDPQEAAEHAVMMAARELTGKLVYDEHGAVAAAPPSASAVTRYYADRAKLIRETRGPSGEERPYPGSTNPELSAITAKHAAILRGGRR